MTSSSYPMELQSGLPYSPQHGVLMQVGLQDLQVLVRRCVKSAESTVQRRRSVAGESSAIQARSGQAQQRYCSTMELGALHERCRNLPSMLETMDSTPTTAPTGATTASRGIQGVGKEDFPHSFATHQLLQQRMLCIDTKLEKTLLRRS